MIRASAPGKLFLAGEYSVLLPEHSCVVAAIDRRVEVEAHPAAAWSARAGEARWSEGEPVPGGLRFVVAAIEAVRARLGGTARALSTHDGLTRDGRKLGLGASAAATIAATFAAADGSGASRTALWAIADEAHRRVQGGRGSGADVAAAFHGGVLAFRREPRRARVLPVDPEVRLFAVFTGESANTVPRVERFDAFARAEPEQARLFATTSEVAVQTLESALAAGDLTLMRAAIGQARAALRGLEEALGLEIETERLALASDVAWRAGAAGKLSGSGGGDCAVVLAVGDDSATRVARALAAAGFEPVPLAVAKEGVVVERG